MVSIANCKMIWQVSLTNFKKTKKVADCIGKEKQTKISFHKNCKLRTAKRNSHYTRLSALHLLRALRRYFRSKCCTVGSAIGSDALEVFTCTHQLRSSKRLDRPRVSSLKSSICLEVTRIWHDRNSNQLCQLQWGAFCPNRPLCLYDYKIEA